MATKPYDVLVPTAIGDTTITGVRLRSNVEPKVVKVLKLQNGKPIQGNGELVTLSARSDSDLVDLKPLDDTAAVLIKGPPKVTTDAYRDGWDTIFGGRKVDGGLN